MALWWCWWCLNDGVECELEMSSFGDKGCSFHRLVLALHGCGINQKKMAIMSRRNVARRGRVRGEPSSQTVVACFLKVGDEALFYFQLRTHMEFANIRQTVLCNDRDRWR